MLRYLRSFHSGYATMQYYTLTIKHHYVQLNTLSPLEQNQSGFKIANLQLVYKPSDTTSTLGKLHRNDAALLLLDLHDCLLQISHISNSFPLPSSYPSLSIPLYLQANCISARSLLISPASNAHHATGITSQTPKLRQISY